MVKHNKDSDLRCWFGGDRSQQLLNLSTFPGSNAKDSGGDGDDVQQLINSTSRAGDPEIRFRHIMPGSSAGSRSPRGGGTERPVQYWRKTTTRLDATRCDARSKYAVDATTTDSIRRRSSTDVGSDVRRMPDELLLPNSKDVHGTKVSTGICTARNDAVQRVRACSGGDGSVWLGGKRVDNTFTRGALLPCFARARRLKSWSLSSLSSSILNQTQFLLYDVVRERYELLFENEPITSA